MCCQKAKQVRVPMYGPGPGWGDHWTHKEVWTFPSGKRNVSTYSPTNRRYTTGRVPRLQSRRLRRESNPDRWIERSIQLGCAWVPWRTTTTVPPPIPTTWVLWGRGAWCTAIKWHISPEVYGQGKPLSPTHFSKCNWRPSCAGRARY